MQHILIAGPTASGKSALALALAERHRGVIINADSMQVYRELATLTARPPAEDLARAPHRLYGHVPAAESYSVARWLGDVRREIEAVTTAQHRLIIVGGTGLYFKALTEGLSPIPEIPREVRQRWRRIAATDGAARLRVELVALDPVMAARLQPADAQRMTRALEVIEATGRSLAEWQAMPGTPVLSATSVVPILIDLPRAVLHARCDQRFELMMAGGASEEVAALLALGLDRSLPVFGALGVTALIDWLEGRCDRATAVEAAKLQTRQYVKRQQTWMKRYMNTWNIVQMNDYCKFCDHIDRLIDR